MMPLVYIRAVRRSRVDARGLLIGDAHDDTLSLMIDDEPAIVCRSALTVATHTFRRGAPVVAPGWQPDVWCPGLHRGRPAFVEQGHDPMRWIRGKTEGAGYIGLNLHDWQGRSDGCFTGPTWWVDAALAACDALAQSGEWEARRHPDGRWCVGLMLDVHE